MYRRSLVDGAVWLSHDDIQRIATSSNELFQLKLEQQQDNNIIAIISTTTKTVVMNQLKKYYCGTT